LPSLHDLGNTATLSRAGRAFARESREVTVDEVAKDCCESDRNYTNWWRWVVPVK